jgi:hypothetical protein
MNRLREPYASAGLYLVVLLIIVLLRLSNVL